MPVYTPRERLGRCIGGRYRVERILAVGGMGVLFAGRDEKASGNVAIKVLKPHDALDLEKDARFSREARIAAQLEHPHVVTMLDCGRDEDGATFLVMELLEGLSLHDELRARGHLVAEELLEIILPIMGALAIAHDQGIVHRDLKPSNIYLAKAGDRVTPKVLDFGIAKGAAGSLVTRTGVVLGTPEYMAPEHALGDTVGPQADVWSIGVVLYRSLSGVLPFSGPAAAVLHQVTHRAPPALDALVPGIGPRFAAAVQRAMVRDLGVRYCDMRQFAKALLWTALADGISVPADPEPRGLCEWHAWRTEAASASERTLRMVIATARRPAASAKLRSGAWIWAGMAATATVFAGAVSLRAAERTTPTRQEHPAISMAAVTPLGTEALEPQAPVLAQGRSEAEARIMAHPARADSPAPVAPRSPQSRPLPRARHRRHSRASVRAQMHGTNLAAKASMSDAPVLSPAEMNVKHTTAASRNAASDPVVPTDIAATTGSEQPRADPMPVTQTGSELLPW